MTSKAFNTQRKRVHISALQKYRKGGSVLVDYRRSRPRWFDGRFLKAADLNRESTYFLTRQADLAVAGGTGVVEGLMVSESGAGRLRIEAGYGMTFDGERVFLPSDVEIAVHNIPLAEQLNADLGLSKKPAPPLRSLSGIYILALRALSFTANPTASYPVDVEGSRRLKDGDIIEATAITLVPYDFPVGAGLFARNRTSPSWLFSVGPGSPTASSRSCRRKICQDRPCPWPCWIFAGEPCTGWTTIWCAGTWGRSTVTCWASALCHAICAAPTSSSTIP